MFSQVGAGDNWNILSLCGALCKQKTQPLKEQEAHLKRSVGTVMIVWLTHHQLTTSNIMHITGAI